MEQHNILKTFFILATPRAIANNPDIIRRFAKCGLKYVFLGIESFDEEVLKELNKPSTLEQNYIALDLLRDLEIEVNAGIICMPHFKQEDFGLLTASLKKYNPIFPMINVLAPMPGTPMFEKYKEEAYISEKKFEAFNMMEHIIEPLHMTKKQFYKNILKVYKFTVGSKITLNYIKQKYGKRELLRHRKISKKVSKKFKTKDN
ncbi:MAG: radical SAM protein [Firmicutes bacterium]|nr:radical SAM protein [Bacillota bacterium]